MNCIRIALIVSCILGISSPVHALIVGSDTSVSRNTFFTFPAIDTDNEIRGFASIDGGFALQDTTTTCTFNGFFSVREKIFLNGGYLTLATNMVLENIATFTNLGNIRSINGDVRSLMLANNTDTLGISSQDAIMFDNIELVLRNNVTLDASIVVEGICRIVGNGNILRLSDNATIAINPNAQLELQGIIVVGTQGENIRCADDSGQLLFTNINWVQTDDFVFNQGAITFSDQVSFMGTSSFSYDSAYTSTILSDSTLKFSDGLNVRMGRNPLSLAEPFAFEDQSSFMHFDNANFFVTDQGMLFTKGTMKFSNEVSVAFDSTSTVNGVVIGTGDPADDFIIEFAPASVMSFTKGHLVYNDSITDGMRSVTQTAQFIRSADANFFVAQNLVISRLNFINISLLVLLPVVNTGKTLIFDNINVDRHTGVFTLSGQLYSSVAALLRGGDDQIFISKGSFPLGLAVQGTGSAVRGTGTIDGSIILTGSSVQLNWDNVGTLNSLITLNGGTLTLGADLMVVGAGGVNGPGTIDLNGKTAFYGINDIVQSTPLTFIGGGAIKFNSRARLAASVLFQDYTTIEGFNNILDVSSGSLVVDSGATLVLKDLVIDQLSGNNIRCVDDTGTIILNNARIILNDSFNFSYGALRFLNNNIFQGEYPFIYETQMTSTILVDSYLKLDTGITFSYAPLSLEGNNQLLEFENHSAQLILNGATFLSTSSGIELTKGTLDVRQTSYMGCDIDTSTPFPRGIAFGDGSNDLNIVIRPNVSLSITNGILEYRNLSNTSLSMQSALSAIALNTDTTLQLYQNLPTGAGRIIFEDFTQLLRSANTNIIGTIEPRGTLIRGKSSS